MYALLQVRFMLLDALFLAAYPAIRSKIKCCGTRPICASCEKRGIDCGYPKHSVARLRSSPENGNSQVYSDTQSQQTDGHGHRPSASVSDESVIPPASITLAEPIGDASFTSVGGDQGQYPYIYAAHDLAMSGSTDWLGEGPIAESAFAEPFIPGLWDFFPISPLQNPQPFLSLPPQTEAQEEASDVDVDVDDDDDVNQSSHTASDFGHPWPMEWNPGSTRLLSLPRLEDFQQNKSIARRTFCGKPITPSGITTLKDRIKQWYDCGPWQQIQLENFPSADSLNHALDMYFVHFHPVLPMIHHPTFNPEKDLVVTLCLITIGVKYTAFTGAQNFSKALFELTRRLITCRVKGLECSSCATVADLA
ncbi:hypothetical protein NX059_002563 [Plenodomus lindquistii]|nr:hypothetical protein NX059_002563 [Plenodomus lindquistii]